MNKQNEDLKKHSSTKDISTNPWLLHLIQIHDTAFPTGSYAHSFGMETYIQENTIRSEKDLEEFCDMYLFDNMGSGDAIIVKEAHKLAKEADVEGLIRLEKICHAMKLAPEARKGSSMLGRQFFQTVTPLNDHELLKQWQEKLKNKEVEGHYPVVYGIYTAILGVNVETALETFLYSSLTSLVQNAVRAVPLGQMGGVQTVYNTLPIIQKTVVDVMNKTLDDLDNNSIALEIASMKHEFLYSRMFIS